MKVVIQERDGYRVSVVTEVDAQAPDFDGASPILRVDSPWRVSGAQRAKHVDSGKWDRAKISSAVEWAAERLFSRYSRNKALTILERYLRVFFGVTAVETYRSDDYLYIAYDPAAWRQAMGGAPEGALDLDEYKAWVEGEVYAWVVEKRVRWQVTEKEDRRLGFGERFTWEEIAACGSYYGYDSAVDGAGEALAEVLGRPAK